jgi:NADH:ubiquinone oxidoreductase subunit F (NADH-binding)/(2Fe-2S) ferredoxin/Pyruvate/2-oxoacid:ferredoxin oxidoreductase delta subunit
MNAAQHDPLTPRPLTDLADLKALSQAILASRAHVRKEVRVCVGTACTAMGGRKVYEAFVAELAKVPAGAARLSAEDEDAGGSDQRESPPRGTVPFSEKSVGKGDRPLSVGKGDSPRETSAFCAKGTGCRGFCQAGPVVVVSPNEFFYTAVKPEDVPEIVEKSVLGDEAVERLLYEVSGQRGQSSFPAEGGPAGAAQKRGMSPFPGRALTWNEIPFYGKQVRVAMRHNGHVDPCDILDYIARGGYRDLWKALTTLTPVQVIEWVERAGLRGRGGAGFPTGRKWRFTRDAPGTPKFIVCNADEGDPGAYMDRSILEGDPHSVLEGMLIGAYAIGASRAYVYVRTEYPLAVKNLGVALAQARAWGLLGERILGAPFSFEVTIKEGAGAFVCGEETAMIASIEGARGMPRMRPPFPAIQGLWGKPTNINNVETWANVPAIIEHGPDWYAAMGTRTSKGTKVFSVVGQVRNSGLVEVPMGITLGEIVEDIGGGSSSGKPVKAVQLGGPSGGCIPARLFTTRVDYEEVTATGAIMGSGGMVVMDEGACMVDIARFFLQFTQNESCGKCTFCRIGTKRMLEILRRITEGKARNGDLALLEELANAVKQTSLCGLGQTAPNPVLTTLRYFRDEYEAHVKERRCPAGVCKALLTFTIDHETCIECGQCAKACPVHAISGERKKQPFVIDQATCIHCGVCRDTCPVDAISGV